MWTTLKSWSSIESIVLWRVLNRTTRRKLRPWWGQSQGINEFTENTVSMKTEYSCKVIVHVASIISNSYVLFQINFGICIALYDTVAMNRFPAADQYIHFRARVWYASLRQHCGSYSAIKWEMSRLAQLLKHGYGDLYSRCFDTQHISWSMHCTNRESRIAQSGISWP